MTCIVGIVGHDGRVTMGGDSAGVNSAEHLQLRQDAKVFRNGRYLIGVSGSWLVNQKLKFNTLPSAPLTRSKSQAHQFMVNTMLPWLEKNIPVSESYEFLLGFEGVIYHFYGHSQVSIEQARFEACGSGAQVARGAMHALACHGMANDSDSVRISLQAAERFCSGVRGPFYIEEIV